MLRASTFHRTALFALVVLIAMTGAMVLAPFLHRSSDGVTDDEVCSAHGTHRLVVLDDSAPAHEPHDHTAHCPLCVPAGAPPPVFVLHIEPVQPLAHVRQSIPAARLAGLVGAPLPARGPPSFV